MNKETEEECIYCDGYGWINVCCGDRGCHIDTEDCEVCSGEGIKRAY